ncbi:MAG: polysaccharide deacetylase [Deinococcales bacterium]
MEDAYAWPGDRRTTVCLTFDCDAESPFLWNEPMEARRFIGELEQRRFGPRVGLPRILALLEELGVPGTFFVPGWTAEHHPGVLEGIVEAGHEVAAHGYVHERINQVSPGEEDAILERSIAVFERLIGQRPAGYRSPSFQLNQGTPALLVEKGLRYDSSLMGYDHPYSLEAGEALLPEIPVEWLLDDAVQYKHVRSVKESNVVAEPRKVERLWMDEFDAMHGIGGRVFVLTMHPWISGRASRLAALRRMIQHMLDGSDVWFASCREVAEYHASSTWLQHYATAVSTPISSDDTAA